MIDYTKHITVHSEIRFGKPCIQGTRITVHEVLEMLANGMSHQEIIEEFPQLSENAIFACLAFAADREQHILRIAS